MARPASNVAMTVITTGVARNKCPKVFADTFFSSSGFGFHFS